MIFDRERLDALVAEGWLRSQRHPDADLWIYNYTERTQFEKHWTPETVACRGLILDAHGAIVARPFPKFFNLHELPDFDPAEHGSYWVSEKIDGSLGIAYWIDGEDDPRIATRGSFTSEQAIEGTRMIQGRELERDPDVTPLFEILYPENRIVVDYGDRRELVLLAALCNTTGGAYSYPGWIWSRVENYGMVALDELLATERPNCEGFVVTFESGTRVKVKHAEYVRLHKLITGINARHVWMALSAGQPAVDGTEGLPDEIYGWIRGVEDRLFENYRKLEDLAAEVFAGRPVGESRKAHAVYFNSKPAVTTAICFRMLDGKPYEDLIWKVVKPEPTTPDAAWSNDAAHNFDPRKPNTKAAAGAAPEGAR